MTFAAHQPAGQVNSADRITHSSFDTEAAVLGAALLGLDDTLVDRLINEHGLRPGHFHNRHNRQIWEAILTLHADRHGIDPLTVTNRLNELLAEHNEITGLRIDNLTADVPVHHNAGHYADELIRLHRWRTRAGHHEREARAILNEDEDAYMAARSSEDTADVDRDQTYDGPALLREFDKDQTGGTRIEVPWRAIQVASGGVKPGDTTLLAAHSSHGKSLAIAEWSELVADRGARVAIYSNEMTPGDYADRLVAGRTDIPFNTILRRWFAGNQLEVYREALRALPVRIVPVFGWPWKEIARHMRASRWDLCSLDLFNRLPGLVRVEDQDEAINGLCNAAAQCGTHLVVASQLRKGGSTRSMTGEALEPSGADLRGSGMLYFSPSNVLFLHRDQEQVKDGDGMLTNIWTRKETGAIWPDKLRQGAPGVGALQRLRLDADRMRFVQPGAWRTEIAA